MRSKNRFHFGSSFTQNELSIVSDSTYESYSCLSGLQTEDSPSSANEEMLHQYFDYVEKFLWIPTRAPWLMATNQITGLINPDGKRKSHKPMSYRASLRTATD